LDKTSMGTGDEIQLTDAIKMLIKRELVEAYHLQGNSYDCGNKLGYMKAFVEYSMRHESLGCEFSTWLKNVLDC
ncbi:MAG: UTP--glucose-1-phosphate uridylyltransferase, partial [Serratia symbiotica]|nr:UTP--glucose-1-phosphate uridylyltransferase [Serratia symbiotica]